MRRVDREDPIEVYRGLFGLVEAQGGGREGVVVLHVPRVEGDGGPVGGQRSRLPSQRFVGASEPHQDPFPLLVQGVKVHAGGELPVQDLEPPLGLLEASLSEQPLGLGNPGDPASLPEIDGALHPRESGSPQCRDREDERDEHQSGEVGRRTQAFPAGETSRH